MSRSPPSSAQARTPATQRLVREAAKPPQVSSDRARPDGAGRTGPGWTAEGDPRPIDTRPHCKALGGRVTIRAIGNEIVLTGSDTGGMLQALKGHEATVTCLVVDADEGTLWSGSVDCTIRKWDLMSCTSSAPLTEHDKMVTCLAMCESEGVVLSGSADCTIRKWDCKTDACAGTFKGHTMIVTCLVVHDEEATAFSGSADKMINLWNIRTGQLMMTLAGHELPITAMTISVADGLLHSGEWGEHTVMVWNLKTRELLKTLHGPPPEITYLQF